jgi:uncharacterized protein (TIGR03435 family)
MTSINENLSHRERRVMPVKITVFALFLSVAMFAQTQQIQFEAASIHAAPPNAPDGGSPAAGVRIDGAQFHAFLPLRAIAMLAWKAGPYQIEAPEWMATQWYDIAAALPEGHKANESGDMLQALLIERFHMKIHRQTKDLAVYALTITQGGIKAREDPLDPAEPSAEAVSSGSEMSAVSRLPRGATLSIGGNRIEAKKFTMRALANQLTSFVDRPVVDQTGLPAEAAYDFSLELTAEDFLATRVRGALAAGFTPPPQAMKYLEATGDSLHQSLAKAGLKLESKKMPMEVLVIDGSDKTPTEN